MKKILVVDDQRCVRQYVQEKLGSEGYRVQGAGTVASADRLLRFFSPDVVVLDLYLEETDAFALFHKIKRQAPNLPVIIFTAYDSYREDPRLSRADGYVIKSMILDELKAKIAGATAEEKATKVTAELGLLPGERHAVGAY
jgi:DNA-binding response OmpR family regulator